MRALLWPHHESKRLDMSSYLNAICRKSSIIKKSRCQIIFTKISVVFLCLSYLNYCRNANASDNSTNYLIEHSAPHILVEGEMLGEHFTFVVDTGSSFFVLDKGLEPLLGEALINSEVEKRTGLSKIQKIFKNSEGKIRADFYDPPKVKILEKELTAKVVITVDLDPLSDLIGKKIDGVIGMDQLRGKELIVDYLTGHVGFEASESVMVNSDAYIDMSVFLGPGGLPVIRGVIDSFEIPFVVDTGFNGSATIVEAAVGDLARLGVLKSRRGVGEIKTVSGEIVAREHLLLEVQLDSYMYSNLIVDEAHQFSVGSAWLKRHRGFHLDLNDYRLRLFSPIYYWDEFPINKTGIRLTTNQNSIFVHSIISRSTGDKSGIRVGDRIIRFNGVQIKASEIWMVRDAFSGIPGEFVRLDIERAGTEIQVDVEIGPDPFK